MKEKLMKLLCVKSIVTIILTFVFSYLCLKGNVTSEEFIMIFTMIVSFYFGTQSEKKDS